MDTFTGIYAKLTAVPGLCDSIGMEKAMEFVRLAARLRDTITVVQSKDHDVEEASEQIPDGMRDFLGSAMNMPLDFVDRCWKAFGSLIWRYDENGETKGTDAEAFRKHGLDNYFSSRMLFPPSHYCSTPGCTNTRLLRDEDGPSKVVFYTLSDGACTTFATHLSCSDYKARYYPNYVVRDGIRIYYDKIPDAIQVAGHQYVERAVLNLFINLMLISWTSATNVRSINLSTVFRPDLCTAKIHVVVIDGITIGHPCCGVLRCPIPLGNNRHHFCPYHAPLRDKVLCRRRLRGRCRVSRDVQMVNKFQGAWHK
ncbi:hypothetical protein B0H17DRAFT_926597 [Mycena rosella]|uniref:Uncharacterized protein n=1 Tax=Mycena rosella TaxID=1033263 RepID=A0AAD7DU99_MYCRO|nr:hypothetical protein B0H17DRAFT_926597 [Mycena rosella]